MEGSEETPDSPEETQFGGCRSWTVGQWLLWQGLAGNGREWQTLKLIKLISQIIAVIKVNGNLIVLVAYLVTKYIRITKDDSTDQTFVEGHSDI